jgi:hypothetical protein
MARPFDFYHKKASKGKRYISGTKSPSGVFVHHPLWCLLTLSPTPSNSSAIKSSENTKQNPDDPEQQMKEISKWNTPLINCAAQL